MKIKKNLKRFFTLSRGNEGFTLVELIVVIAILAILAGVAVPAYSGYISKTNQAADQKLVGEIKNALTLAYYSDPNFKNGYVALSMDKAPDCGQNTAIENALTQAFGENWRTSEAMYLKYDGWSATFQGSNFFNSEDGLTGLMGTVETLTGALGGFLDNSTIAGMLGDNFNSYMEDMGAENSAQKSDAAVFYVADITAGLEDDALQRATDALMANINSPADVALGAMNAELGSSIASASALYALAEGYATFFDNGNYEIVNKTDGQDKTPRQILTEATANISASSGSYANTAEAFGALMTAFNRMGQVNPAATAAYMDQSNGNSSMSQDMNAFADAMKTISSSKDSIMENMSNNGYQLGSDNYFNNDVISGVLSIYAEGGIFVYAVEKDGVITVSSSLDGN